MYNPPSHRRVPYHGRGEEAPHQEAPECLHALHEGNEGPSGGGVHPQGIRRHQPDTGPQGRCLGIVFIIILL